MDLLVMIVTLLIAFGLALVCGRAFLSLVLAWITTHAAMARATVSE